MRIIAGAAKGRNLFSPIGATRPTSDRAREALFSSLESEFGSLEGLAFLDLYCGSGAVSAEALSRGAAIVHAVDKDEKATTIARKNHELVEAIVTDGKSSIFTMSSGKYLESMKGQKFDIVFLDPPYDTPRNEVEKTLRAIVENGLLKNSSVIALERDSRNLQIEWPPGVNQVKERRYGAATILYAEPEGA